MPKVRLKQFAQDGATDGQVATWNNAAGKWEPDDAGAGGAAEDLATSGSDVAIDSTAPAAANYILKTTSTTVATWQLDTSGILTGAVDPTTEGVEGNFYYNTVKRGFWYKDSGGWEEVGVVADDTTIEIHVTNGLQVKDDGVTYAKMQNVVANNVLLGNNAGAGGIVDELTGTEATALLDTFSTSTTTKGLVPGSNGAAATVFLNATGAWSTPAGGGAASDNKPACFRVSGSSNILNTADSQMVFDTTDVSEANYSLSAGTVTVTDAGTYFISYSIPINEDGTGGATRTRVYGWVEDDGTPISQSYSQCYVREASGGGGISAGFVAVLGASSDLDLYARSQNSTDISSESGQATISIFKLGTG